MSIAFILGCQTHVLYFKEWNFLNLLQLSATFPGQEMQPSNSSFTNQVSFKPENQEMRIRIHLIPLSRASFSKIHI